MTYTAMLLKKVFPSTTQKPFLPLHFHFGTILIEAKQRAFSKAGFPQRSSYHVSVLKYPDEV